MAKQQQIPPLRCGMTTRKTGQGQVIASVLMSRVAEQGQITDT
jgi:hypothetical protein